jgi:VanZ family protein
VSGRVTRASTQSSTSGQWLALWAPVVAYMALLFALSSMALPPSPTQVNDKTQHFLGYGGLGALALRAASGGALSGLTPGAAVAAWALAAVYGVTDEYHQRFVPGRTADVADAVADAAGGATAIVALWAFGIIARSRRSSGAATRRR